LNSLILYFFFSSRRRHTRFSRDWSSDVCSSDLQVVAAPAERRKEVLAGRQFQIVARACIPGGLFRDDAEIAVEAGAAGPRPGLRSEERRVGKECRSWW